MVFVQAKVLWQQNRCFAQLLFYQTTPRQTTTSSYDVDIPPADMAHMVSMHAHDVEL